MRVVDPQPVVAAQHVDEHGTQTVALVGAERHEAGRVLFGDHPQAVRKLRRKRYVRGPGVGVVHDSSSIREFCREIGTDGAAVLPRYRSFVGWRGWNMSERVNLTMRVSDRGANFCAAIFEDEYVFDLRSQHQVGSTVGPEIDDYAYFFGVQAAKRCFVVAGKQDHFGRANRGACRVAKIGGCRKFDRFTGVERRPTICEPHDIVRCWCFESADAKRAPYVGGASRKIGPRLAVPDDAHPFVGHRIETKLTSHHTIMSYRATVFTIRRAELNDSPTIGAVQGRAFCDDPLQAWAIPDSQHRLELLTTMFELITRVISIPLGESYVDEQLGTAAFWVPPGRWGEPITSEAGEALRALDGQLTSDIRNRFAKANEVMHAAHPTESHWYLQGLGTDPHRQGAGLGSAVLQPVLDRADATSVPCYLESTKADNVGFYERHRFQVVETLEIPGGGPTLWAMRREPVRQL